MIRNYCDSCGVEVTEENGVIGSKELTIEFPDRKISIAVEVETWERSRDERGAICVACVTKRFAEWESQNMPS